MPILMSMLGDKEILSLKFALPYCLVYNLSTEISHWSLKVLKNILILPLLLIGATSPPASRETGWDPLPTPSFAPSTIPGLGDMQNMSASLPALAAFQGQGIFCELN